MKKIVIAAIFIIMFVAPLCATAECNSFKITYLSREHGNDGRGNSYSRLKVIYTKKVIYENGHIEYTTIYDNKWHAIYSTFIHVECQD